ncbi:hypothetical protein BT96DRAFT_866263, partial [Gymnopus androsaceus JB14]
MVSRRRCPVCGSKQWHKEPSSGLIACSEGHILQNYRNETNEAEDVGNHMMKKRALKSNRQKKERKSRVNHKLYHGSRGRYLYFQCQQLILRKQIAALTRLWNLPKEFEMACRDLWALHLSLLSDPPPSEPFFDPSPARSSTLKQEHGRSHSRTRTKTRPHSPETRPNSPLPSDSPSSSSSSSEEADSENQIDSDEAEEGGDEDGGKDTRKEEEEDPELAELMRENSESEDDDDEEDELDDSGKNSKGAQESRRKRGHSAYEGPANNLAVLMVACWMLRIPVMYRDLTQQVESYALPYLDPVRLLPNGMVSHLTKHNIQALSPTHAPKTLILHALASRLAKQLCQSYKILTPETNVAPMLWRIIQGIGGTPTLYAMTKRLARILSLPLALHQSLVPKLLQLKKGDPQTHKFDNAPVEASLLAAVIVVLKMVYGLNGESKQPTDDDDPAFALPCVEDYLGLVRQFVDADPRHEALFNSEKPISMDIPNDDMLDGYLEFCERILLRPGRTDNVLQGQKQMLADYFPVNKTFDSPRSGEFSPPLKLSRRPPNADDIGMTGLPRPGEKYSIYHSRDALGSVPDEYEMVIKRGSELVQIPPEYLHGLVEKYERRKLWKKP